MSDIISNLDLTNINLSTVINSISSPSFKTVQMAVVIYLGLLWLAIIIWVTRDAIHRSDSLIFQVIAILINIIFPILGILLYLIIRPGKTTTERYYEELEHRLILESIGEKEEKEGKHAKKEQKKKTKK
jgi:ABC-type multidrug transport system fused ATPase/permease subunit